MSICMWPKAGCPMADTSHAMPCHWHPGKQFLSKGCSTHLQAQPAVLDSFCHSSKSLTYSSYWGVFKSKKEKISQKSDYKWKDVERFKYLLLHFLKLTPILCSLNTILKPVPTDMLKHNINRRIITLNFLPKWYHLLVKVTWFERLTLGVNQNSVAVDQAVQYISLQWDCLACLSHSQDTDERVS